MRKNVFIFGSLAGLIITANMVYWSTVCTNNPEFESNDALGYAGMIISFSFIFFGIKNYRDKQNDGVITFGQGFRMGFFMALIASTIYVGVWLIHYHFFVPEFVDQYIHHVLYEAKLKVWRKGKSSKKHRIWRDSKRCIRISSLSFLLAIARSFPLQQLSPSSVLLY
jgi:hypothetical protein